MRNQQTHNNILSGVQEDTSFQTLCYDVEWLHSVHIVCNLLVCVCAALMSCNASPFDRRPLSPEMP